MDNLKDVIAFLMQYDGEPVTIMEVCGTHTAEIFKNGIRSLLSPKIKLVSGPGCPVCVTSKAYVDKLCKLALSPNTVVYAYGDMFKVAGNNGCLSDAKAAGGRVELMYTPFDCLKAALANPGTEYVVSAVGFETTAPIYALLLHKIIESGAKNIRFLTALKTVPEVIELVCELNTDITGFICPGHVCAVTGVVPFVPVAQKQHKPFVVAGFSAEQILSAIYLIIKKAHTGCVHNLYTEVVREKGNPIATEMLYDCCVPEEACWRGLGTIPGSGIYLRKEYAQYDAGSHGLVDQKTADGGCRCADVLTGIIEPIACPLFGKVCRPGNPQGACMVSNEGSCGIWYNATAGKYEK